MATDHLHKRVLDADMFAGKRQLRFKVLGNLEHPFIALITSEAFLDDRSKALQRNEVENKMGMIGNVKRSYSLPNKDLQRLQRGLVPPAPEQLAAMLEDATDGNIKQQILTFGQDYAHEFAKREAEAEKAALEPGGGFAAKEDKRRNHDTPAAKTAKNDTQKTEKTNPLKDYMMELMAARVVVRKGIHYEIMLKEEAPKKLEQKPVTQQVLKIQFGVNDVGVGVNGPTGGKRPISDATVLSKVRELCHLLYANEDETEQAVAVARKYLASQKAEQARENAR